MQFRPDQVRGASGQSGTIDFRLVRRHLVAEYRRGRLSRLDVCDAHPDLIRAAENLGKPTPETCPICEERQLVHVSYVFGGRLPASGRCVADLKELNKLSRQYDELACYVVEVCPACRWNHLARTFRLGRSNAS